MSFFSTRPVPLSDQPVPPSGEVRHVDWLELAENLGSLSTQAADRFIAVLDHLVGRGSVKPAEAEYIGRQLGLLHEGGRSAQQLVRLNRGRVRLSREDVNVLDVWEELLQEQRQQLERQRINFKLRGEGAPVLADPALLHALMSAMLSWGLACGTRIRVRLSNEVSVLPAHVNVTLSATEPSTADTAARRVAAGVTWQLVTQIAETMGLPIERVEARDGGMISVRISPLVNQYEGLTMIELEDSAPSSALHLGKVVLVISTQQAFRAAAREALRDTTYDVETVGNVAQARDAIFYKTPAAIVVDAQAITPEFEELRSQLLVDMGTFAFVEVFDDRSGHFISGLDNDKFARISLKEMPSALVPVLAFEIAKAQ